MKDSSSKRRQTSPTTSVPVNTSNTPSRIPIPTQSARHTPSRRPSFASPTKASLSRHNPQLLNRPSSSGGNPVRPGSRGRDLQDAFALALIEKRGPPRDSERVVVGDVSESVATTQTTQENDPPTEVLIAQSQEPIRRATTPKGRGGNVRIGISGKSRRISRSPAKKVERTPFEGSSQSAAIDFKDINPFVKKGLRRSPPASSQQSQAEPQSEDPFANPFKKTGLRRSPVSSQVTASQVTGSVEERDSQNEARSKIQKSGLRRSPILSRPMELVESDVQPQEQLEIQTGGVDRSPNVSELVESIEENNIQLLSGFGIQSGERRSSLILPLHEDESESIRSLMATNTQQQTREDTIPLTRSPHESVKAEIIEQDTIEVETSLDEMPEVTRSLRHSPSPLLSNEKVRGASLLQESPIPRRNLQQTPDTEVQVEEQAGAQLEAELQYSTIMSDPSVIQPSPEIVSESHTPTSEPMNQPAQYATTELLRATSRLGKKSQSRSPRIVKSPAHSKDEEFTNPFLTRRYEEPDLPPTPTQRGIPDPVVTTPSSGIHDTPSKRARRRKGFSANHKSSPLKPTDQRPEDVSIDTNSQERATSRPQQLVAKELSRRRRSSRFISPVDVHAAKKRKRDDLLRQLQQLQADVSLANQENERIRVLCEAKKRPLGTAPNADELLAMLLRSTVPESSLRSEPPKVSVLKTMDAFLPFRPRRKPVQIPDVEKPLPSHLPIALDDPLPYLQAFSPLSYTSTMTLMPTSPPASETSSGDTYQTLQKYVINASHPSGVFAARLAMVADFESLAIKTIDVLRLDMSAEVELGAFIRDRAVASGPLGKDITVICWAMARWVEVSMKRARFWCAVESEFGDSQARESALQKTKKRKRHVDTNKDDDDMEKQWTRRQLLPNMGRTSMVLGGKNVKLRFEWKLSFDFTGEVESYLTADARIPAGWQGLDDRNSLAKVPETFGRLVKDEGPLSAVRTLVGLMLV